MSEKKLTFAIAGCLMLLAAVPAAHANGYKVLCVKSAKATAMGEAFVAQADDPSALAINPAGLAQLKGNQACLQATICGSSTRHTTPAGAREDMKEKWQTVPSAFVTTDAGLDGVVLGLGVSLPNGLSSEWAKNSSVRYVATYSDLRVVDISPAVGLRVSDNLLIGFGLDIYDSSARLERMADLGLAVGAPGMLDAESRMKGSGTALGANAGLIYRINARHAVGLTYRHSYRIDYEGDYSLAGAGIRTDAEASIEFPPVVVAGYAFRPDDRWKFEIDLDWTGWDSVGDIEIDFENPFLPDAAQQQDLNDTLAVKLGAEYALSQDMRLRAGYIRNQNATPENAWRPSLPDTDAHFVTAGFGYEMGSLTLDTAIQFVFNDDRRIDNNVDGNEFLSSSSIDGKYETFSSCFSVAATYRF